MRRLILSMLMCMMMLGAIAQSGKFTVKGTFTWAGDSVKFDVVEWGSFKTIYEKTFAVTGEMLEMSCELEDAEVLCVSNKNEDIDYWDHNVIPAIPGETVVIYQKGDKDIHLDGSQFYLDFDQAVHGIAPKLLDLIEIHSRLSGKSGGATNDDLEQYVTINNEVESAVLDYVKANPDQDAAIAVMAIFADDKDNERGAAMLTERVLNGVASNLYKTKLDAAKKQAEEIESKSARLNGLEGSMAPDFTLNDINGKPLALSSLRGKWVIIDFWGSWCKWCIKGIPQMKEYYAKYGDKLEILGVDCNDTVEKWKAAVAEHEIPWLHVYWDKEKGDNPLMLYGVSAFPTKVIVDPEGKVAKVIVGEAPAFYEYLDEVLK